MSNAIDIPRFDHEVFARPPLKAMLGQLRFPTVLRIADIGSLVPFQDAVRHQFPTFRQEQQLTLTVGLQGPQGPTLQPAFRFITGNGGWSFLLTPDAVTLEADVTAGYTSYDEFVDQFRLVWEAILANFSPDRVSRQGLRYVDHIEGELAAPDWASLINPELLGPVVDRFGAAITQTASELRLTRQNGVLVFKHGMLPLGPEARMGYMLDFDYFNEEASDDTSVEAVMSRFNAYHQTLYSLFRWCVTDTALEAFRAEQ